MPMSELEWDLGSALNKSLIAGSVAGTAVDLSLYPIDTLKTRLQSSGGFVAAGGFRGVYAGVGSAVVGSAPGGALFFVTYEYFKNVFRTYHTPTFDDGAKKHSDIGLTKTLEHMGAASLGEIAACAIRVPTEVIKQRTQAMQSSSSLAALHYILSQRRSGGLVAVWKELYRGWNITILREIPFTVIQFPLWEAMKKWRLGATGHETTSAVDSAVFGAVSGAVAAAATTPLDVLKTRTMLSKEKQALLPLSRRILEESGPKTFFIGLGPRIIWVSTGGAIFLGSYQWVMNALHRAA